MLKPASLIAGLALLWLGACVAAEEPETRAMRSPAPRPAASSSQARFEDAPIPNRRVGRGTDDGIIHLAR